MSSDIRRYIIAGLCFFLIATLVDRAHASCGAAFCTLNTQWETQGVWTEPGTRADLRFEYIDQDQPRVGTHKVDVGAIRRHHDEVRTINRNWILTLDHTFSPAWGVSLQLPFVQREHIHIHNHHGARLTETWSFAQPGDARLLARHQLSAGERGARGILFGAKLPTGSFDEKNAEGQEAERSLQPGTGTVDAIAGLYLSRMDIVGGRPLAQFVQAQVQRALDERRDYRPGAEWNADAGVSYPLTRTISGALQVNARIKGRDSGAEAEAPDTGGSFVWLSPGIDLPLGRSARVYGFVQLPLYQRVNGIQLTADWAATAGMSWRF